MINNRPILNNSFEEYLKNIFTEGYIGVGDEVEDKYEQWVENLDVAEVIDYGNSFGRELLVLLDKANQNEPESVELD